MAKWLDRPLYAVCCFVGGLYPRKRKCSHEREQQQWWYDHSGPGADSEPGGNSRGRRDSREHLLGHHLRRKADGQGQGRTGEAPRPGDRSGPAGEDRRVGRGVR